MSTVQEIAFSLSSSAERRHQFQEKLKETPASQVQMGRRAKLRTLCETRWAATMIMLTLCVLLSYHLT